MPLALTILQQGQDYIFFWDPLLAATHSARADSSHAATERLVTTHLDAQKRANLQGAIDLAAQVASQLAETRPAAGPRGLAAIQSLERLGRVMFSQILPAALQDTIRELPAASPLLLTSNDRRLPWELLHDDQEFLTLRHAVGRRLLTGESARGGPREARDHLRCLLIGNPTGDLPAADEEAEALIEVLDLAPRRIRAEILFREQASRMRVLEALADDQYDIIHFAGHARPGALHLADGWLETDEIHAALRGHPLIFLNACNSAREEISPDDVLPYAGQQARNLASAFLLGGASTFVGTLWPVFDDCTRQVATDFYRSVVRGQPVGEALRMARTRCRQSAPGEIVWASFVLYGDPMHRVMTSGLSYHSGTVLAAQLSNPYTRWQDRHIEAAAQRLRGEMTRLVHRIAAHGGRVIAPGPAQIIAVFGVPQAIEDDAERALRVALEIQHATADLEMEQPTIGVASGEIMVDPSFAGAGDRPVYLGPAMTEALHLAQQSQPGQVVAGQTTHKLAEGLFHFAPLADPEESITAYQVSPMRRRVTVSEQPSMEMALIGRAEALAMLTSYWNTAKRGRGQVIGIAGEAGIGKSRLLQAFRQSIESEDHLWLETVCPSTGREAPYTLLAQLLQLMLGISPDDDDTVIDRKITQRLEELSESAGVDPQLIGILKATLGLPVSGLPVTERRAGQGRLVHLLRSVMAEAARRAPLVVALEDMQWVDDASLKILDQLTDGVSRLPVQVLVLYRPEWDHPWFHKPYYRHLPLEPLDDTACVRLLQTLLGSADLPDGLLALLKRTGGNPFFIEEMVKSLKESGDLLRQAPTEPRSEHSRRGDRGDGIWHLTRPLSDTQLPDTIQRTLLARFDRLQANTRQALQVASAIGAVFAPSFLVQLLGDLDSSTDYHLAELEDRGFIYPRWDTGDYVFRHALIQEAAYQSLPAAQRRAYHRRIGEMLEHGRDALNASVETLAHHYYRSLVIAVSRDQQSLAEDVDSEQLRKAIRYLTQAGNRAQERYAAQEALNYYRRALTVSRALPDGEEHLVTIHAGMGDAHNILGDFDSAISHLRQALATLHTRPLSRADRRRAADLARRIGRLYGWQGEYETALSWMHEGLRQLGETEDEDDRATAALLHIHAGSVHYYQGDHAGAAQQCLAGLELAEADQRRSVQAEGLNLLGVIYDTQGQTDEALEHYRRSLAIWEDLADAYQAARVEDNIGTAHFYRGDWDTARMYYERSLAFWEQIEDQDNVSYACLNLGGIYLHQGDWEQARQSFERALELWERVQNQRMIAQAHNNLGLLCIEQEDWDRAQEHLERSRDLLLRLEVRDLLPETHRGLAEVALGRQHVDEAVELADKAVTLAAELQMRFEQALALRALGRAHEARRGLAQALEHLNASLAILEKLHSRYEVGRTLYYLALLEAEAGEEAKAKAHLNEAIAIFEDVGAKKDMDRLQEKVISHQ